MGARPRKNPCSDAIDAVMALYERLGAERYGLEPMSQLSHALQSARLAELANAQDALVAAALLHDIGHLLQNDLHDAPKEDHSAVGARYLAQWFGPEVTEPIRLHAEAKRYLVTIDPLYVHRVSAASRRSLRWQGGAMGVDDAQAFFLRPCAHDAVMLRRWDDRAKAPQLRLPPIAHYRVLLESLIAQPR
jgi:gamma-butyrobetaine dioxygenase